MEIFNKYKYAINVNYIKGCFKLGGKGEASKRDAEKVVGE
jgi:hypothetical protein